MSSPRRGRRLLATLATTTAILVAMSGLAAAPASAKPIPKCAPNPIGHAISKRDHNVVGGKPYFLTVESMLWRCGGYVKAVHSVWIDSRWLDLGTEIHVRISTRRSDGVWVGADRTVTAGKAKSPVGEHYTQLRGVGGGLRLTDVHVKHFAEPGQSALPIAPWSTARASYGPWNGPEGVSYPMTRSPLHPRRRPATGPQLRGPAGRRPNGG